MNILECRHIWSKQQTTPNYLMFQLPSDIPTYSQNMQKIPSQFTKPSIENQNFKITKQIFSQPNVSQQISFERYHRIIER